MEVQFFGANCLRINSKKASIVVDDNLAQLGLKAVTKPADLALHTMPAIPTQPSHFLANMPGEYEVSGVSIRGIAARSHMDSEKAQTATIFTIDADDTRIAIVGHIYPELSEEQLEKIGSIDAAIIPVGNNGYTLDGHGALKVIKQIEPKIVIPTHYGDKALKYEVPQTELAEAIKDLGMEPSETTDKYKIRPGELADSTKLIILSRQS